MTSLLICDQVRRITLPLHSRILHHIYSETPRLYDQPFLEQLSLQSTNYGTSTGREHLPERAYIELLSCGRQTH